MVLCMCFPRTNHYFEIPSGDWSRFSRSGVNSVHVSVHSSALRSKAKGHIRASSGIVFSLQSSAFSERIFPFDREARRKEYRRLAEEAIMITLKVWHGFQSQISTLLASDGISPPVRERDLSLLSTHRMGGASNISAGGSSGLERSVELLVAARNCHRASATEAVQPEEYPG
jgi:hypothetical protein